VQAWFSRKDSYEKLVLKKNGLIRKFSYEEMAHKRKFIGEDGSQEKMADCT
jgi:hypothetical protein